MVQQSNSGAVIGGQRTNGASHGGSPAPNLSAVRALIADAKSIATVRRFEGDPEPGLPRGGVDPGRWIPNALGLPSDCPVIPLGIAGNVGWFIDPIGQVQSLEPPYGKGHLLGLFCGRANYLAWAWPRWGKKGIDGYAAENAAAALVNACAAKGPWSSVEKVRGRGAWTDHAGGLVLHTGTDLLIGGRREPPGEIDGFVYPTRPAIPSPWPGDIDADKNPARLLMPMLRSWQWSRADVDPVLLLGWIAASFLGGALPWRPTVYMTGDKATGKSTLQGLIKGLLGECLIQAVDTSAAGVYQHIGNDSLPIAVDELEGEADVRKAKAVLKLARLAASGGLMLRGGERHSPVEFRARSCFLFSSINTPPLEPQDLSRMAILRLHRLPVGQVSPDLDPQILSVVGRCILRRVIEEWPRFPQTFSAFKAELARGGMDGRGQDTFGTLVACADLLEHRGWNEERLKYPTISGDLVAWSELMASSQMAEFEDAAENWRLCLSHLLSVSVDAWRNGLRTTVGQVIEAYFAREEPIATIDEAKRLLAQAGLALVRRDDGSEWLAIPNQNALTRRLFDGSKWAGDVGAGVWAGALRQSPRGTLHDVAKARINGDVQPSTLIALDALYGDGGIMRIK